MLSLLKSNVLLDGVLHICVVILIFLIWRYKKTKDKELLYFIAADSFYILGEFSCDIFGNLSDFPIDFIFFFLFYFCVFLFFKHRTKSLLKNPIATENSDIKTWVLIVIDYIIIAIFSFVVYFYFDRISLTTSLTISSIRLSMITNFLYPVIDFFFVGYYITINKIYIISDKKIYIPLIFGISFWTIGDFLFAYEDMFKLKTNDLGSYLQIFGIALLILLLFFIKKSKMDSYYTTIDLYKDNSKLGNYNLLINSLVALYIFIYIYIFIVFDISETLMKPLNFGGIILLSLAVLRQNVINYDLHYKLNRMSRDANTDPLTGLYSRKYAFTLIQSLYKSSLYFNMKMSVLMLDIDYFKNYNDTYGHINGDHVLQDIAWLINRSIDTSNIVCRYGGEEFLIVLPGVDKTNGIKIAETIRKNIEEHDFNQGEHSLTGKITVSIGGATADSKIQDEINFVEKADAALYMAKKDRNKSVWFSHA